MHVCVWYTELTCISNGVSKKDIVVGKVQCVCVCVCVLECVCVCVCVRACVHALTDGGATPVAGRP